MVRKALSNCLETVEPGPECVIARMRCGSLQWGHQSARRHRLKRSRRIGRRRHSTYVADRRNAADCGTAQVCSHGADNGPVPASIVGANSFGRHQIGRVCHTSECYRNCDGEPRCLWRFSNRATGIHLVHAVISNRNSRQLGGERPPATRSTHRRVARPSAVHDLHRSHP